MTISEMHSAFRTIGQQMGLQLVRGILPESIDVFLNDVIQEKVQQELLVTTRTVIQETTDIQASTMGGFNILRNLHRADRFIIQYPFQCFNNGVFTNWDKSKEIENLGIIDYYNPKNSYYEITIPVAGYTLNKTNIMDKDTGGRTDVDVELTRISPMMYLSFSLEYTDTNRSNQVPTRLIGADVLETTLRDFCNGADKNSPIVSILSKTSNDGKSQNYIQIYINKEQTEIKAINIKYIKNPNVVSIGNNIDCDLPEYCHYEIVEKAVQKYKIAISGQITDSRNNR